MTRLILVALLIPPILNLVGVLGWVGVAAAELAIVLVAAWNFDRHRRPGARDPFRDSNRADFPVPMTGGLAPTIPTEAVQSPADRGGPDGRVSIDER